MGLHYKHHMINSTPNEIEVSDDCVIIRSPALVREIRDRQGNINDDTA